MSVVDEYKQEVATLYDQRSQTYDRGDFHPSLADHLIQQARIQPGQKVLDLATGTGLVALKAAQLVGSTGKVVGVDISTGLLRQAKRKLETTGLTNVEFIFADVETFLFPEHSFERILCCSALPLIPNVPANLCRWQRFLVPDGLIGLCVFAETAEDTGLEETSRP